jgi:hypothetical protein
LSHATSSLSRSASGKVSGLVLVASGRTGRESGWDRGALSGCIELEIRLMYMTERMTGRMTGSMTPYLFVHLILENINVFRRDPSLGTTCSVIRSYRS